MYVVVWNNFIWSVHSTFGQYNLGLSSSNIIKGDIYDITLYSESNNNNIFCGIGSDSVIKRISNNTLDDSNFNNGVVDDKMLITTDILYQIIFWKQDCHNYHIWFYLNPLSN